MKYECVTDGYDNWYAVPVVDEGSVLEFVECMADIHSRDPGVVVTFYPVSPTMAEYPEWIAHIGGPLD